jgi:hypothetical protein
MLDCECEVRWRVGRAGITVFAHRRQGSSSGSQQGACYEWRYCAAGVPGALRWGPVHLLESSLVETLDVTYAVHTREDG